MFMFLAVLRLLGVRAVLLLRKKNQRMLRSPLLE